MLTFNSKHGSYEAFVGFFGLEGEAKGASLGFHVKGSKDETSTAQVTNTRTGAGMEWCTNCRPLR